MLVLDVTDSHLFMAFCPQMTPCSNILGFISFPNPIREWYQDPEFGGMSMPSAKTNAWYEDLTGDLIALSAQRTEGNVFTSWITDRIIQLQKLQVQLGHKYHQHHYLLALSTCIYLRAILRQRNGHTAGPHHSFLCCLHRYCRLGTFPGCLYWHRYPDSRVI